MPDKIGYYSPDTAKFIHQVVNELVRQGFVTKSGQKGSDRNTPTTITYATATTGITSGSSASCLMKRRGASALENVKDNAGSSLSITVYNDFTEDVATGALIVAAWSFGKWIAIAEDCPVE